MGKKKTKDKKQKKKDLFALVKGFLILKEEAQSIKPFSIVEYVLGVLVLLGSFWIYLKTLTPDIGFHDSGDMIPASFHLGICHPPGYPFYNLFGKLFSTFIPLGNIAYRFNLMSAIFASLTCSMVYFIVLKLSLKDQRLETRDQRPKTKDQRPRGNFFSLLFFSFSPLNKVSTSYPLNFLTSHLLILFSSLPKLIPAIVSSFMLAFSVTFWEQAVVAEKYALNALFATLLIFILLKWQEVVTGDRKQKTELRKEDFPRVPGPESRVPILDRKQMPEIENRKSKIKNQKFYLYLFAFTLGLSFTHHMQTIFVVPASIFLIIIISWLYPSSISPSSLGKMLCCFFLPLLLYIYLPIRAYAHPPLNWGDPITFPRFMDYITLKAYKHFFISSPQVWLQNFQHHLTHFFTHQFTFWVVWFGVIGLVILLVKRKIIGIFLILIFLTDIVSSIRYGISNIEDYYIPGFIIFSIFIGYGLMYISRLLPHSLMITPFIFLPLIPYTTHHYHCDHRNYFFAHDLAEGLLKNLDSNAALFIKGDVNGFPVWYLHYVENKRQDVALIDTPFLFQDWYAQDIQYKYGDLKFDLYPTHAPELGQARFDEILMKNFDKRPFYQYSDEPVPKGFTTIPVWFFLKILKADTPKDVVLKELEKGSDEIIMRGGYKKDQRLKTKDQRPEGDKKEVSRDEKANDVLRNCAGGYNNRGNNYLGMGRYDKAIEELKKSANLDPNLPVVYYNLGRAYSEQKMVKEAIDNFKKALELNPNFQDLHRRIALLYQNIGKMDEAISEYIEEAKLSPSIEIYNILAQLYYEKKQIDKVIEQCQNILQLDPNHYEARKNLASLYFTQKRFLDAQREFNILLSKYPNDSYAQNMLASIQKQL